MNVLITGGSGMVGNNLKMHLPDATYISSKHFDLTREYDVKNMFDLYRPTHVIHLASKVGGIGANIKQPVEFYEQNILINTNILRYAHEYNVERLISTMSTCMFPDNIEYPLESYKIHNGEPHISNFGYAYAKRMLEVHTRAYQLQYNKKWTTVVPTNIYGKHDQFNIKKAHVIPALIHKCYLAKINNTSLNVMGTGEVYREFIYAEDLAKILAWAIFYYDEKCPLIISTPTQHKIKDVVSIIVDKMNFKGLITFDENENNNGQTRKPSNIDKLQSLYPIEYTPFDVGISDTIDWFLENYDNKKREWNND